MWIATTSEEAGRYRGIRRHAFGGWPPAAERQRLARVHAPRPVGNTGYRLVTEAFNSAATLNLMALLENALYLADWTTAPAKRLFFRQQLDRLVEHCRAEAALERPPAGSDGETGDGRSATTLNSV